MAKAGTKPTAAIQKLLADRSQIERWLERLDIAADKTPDHVRTKVRSDYQQRLTEIIHELTTFSAELTEALAKQRLARTEMAKQEGELSERLAEAELRHAVGEYDEGTWRTLNAEILGSLVKVREELRSADEEIARMDEIVGLVRPRSPEPIPPPRAPVAEPAHRTAPVVTHTPPARPVAPPPPAPAPRAPVAHPPQAPPFTPSPAAPAAPPAPVAASDRRNRPSGQREAFDELAFLKAVTEDERNGPAPSRASGGFRRVEDQSKPPIDVGASEVEVLGREDPAPRSSSGAIKTLRCAECGTLNLPTEWYCERCGAELAAL